MALKQETKDKIKAFGFDVEKLITAVTAAEEVDYEVPEDVTVLKTADLEKRDANKISEGKRIGEAEGEKKGKELSAKAFKRKFGIEENLPPDIDKVAEAVEKKLGQGDTALKDQVKLLLSDKETLTREKEAAERRAESSAWDAELISYFPANRNTDLSDAERLALVKMNLSFDTQEGKRVVKRNGEILRDKDSQSPVNPDQAISGFFTEKKWVATPGTPPPPGGRGAGDNPPPPPSNGIKKASAFEAKWLSENPGKNILSDEYINAFNKQVNEVPDFDMYS